MNVQITSRHSKASKSLKDSLLEDIKRLERFSDKITSCRVVLDNEHINKTVEIVINVMGSTVKATTRSENIGKAVDMALEKIQRQLTKLNKKIKNHKTKTDNKEFENNTTK